MNTIATPVGQYGQLQVRGTKLCDESGEPVQLRGMSTHGIQWFGWGSCVTPDSLDALANDWQSELCRITMYIQEGGYETNPDRFTAEVNTIIEEVTKRGLYAVIDFHTLDPGNPMENLRHAKRFFNNVATEHSHNNNLIYEICNEPNGVDWTIIKSYAEEVIPVIRAHDTTNPIVIGTPGWSSLGLSHIGSDGPQEIINNPVEGDNLLYTYHFYAATHGQWERKQLDVAAEELPIFVTECGSMEATGGGDSDFESTQAFMDIMDDYTISWAFWSYSDGPGTASLCEEGTSDDGQWIIDNLTQTGKWARKQIRNGEM